MAPVASSVAVASPVTRFLKFHGFPPVVMKLAGRSVVAGHHEDRRRPCHLAAPLPQPQIDRVARLRAAERHVPCHCQCSGGAIGETARPGCRSGRDCPTWPLEQPRGGDRDLLPAQPGRIVAPGQPARSITPCVAGRGVVRVRLGGDREAHAVARPFDPSGSGGRCPRPSSGETISGPRNRGSTARCSPPSSRHARPSRDVPARAPAQLEMDERLVAPRVDGRRVSAGADPVPKRPLRITSMQSMAPPATASIPRCASSRGDHVALHRAVDLGQQVDTVAGQRIGPCRARIASQNASRSCPGASSDMRPCP
jgi:hypothetical protein